MPEDEPVPRCEVSSLSVPDEKTRVEHAMRRLLRVTFGAFDLGADKMAGTAGSLEANPMLGCRQIRVFPDHPEQSICQMRALLRMMRRIIPAGHRHNRPVSLCGEMASDPIYTIILLGLGVDELSVNPVMVPAIRALRPDVCAPCAHVSGCSALGLQPGKKGVCLRGSHLFPDLNRSITH
ncbi:MAG TPA: hypothetical protein PLL20_13975 [Phycisphaerae bacterium]|nr:hypothetical protein [Phycisphaerae bacterium]HRR86014.1 hypothetical protein [Phycisphaerae bacterium]